jgi:glycosyltransferase involved in cell wall biosynthesis
MNILMVVHQFLPRHLAGSEVYTYRLAQALRARGHRVHIFCTEIRPERPQYELTRGEFHGIPCFEAVHNRIFPSFRHSYRDPEMERLFGRVLDEAGPDIMHIQHLYLHSIGYIDIARRRGVPILYTLHEYMLMCLNSGLLLRPGARLCDGPEPAECARCAAVAYPFLPVERRLARLPGLLQRLATRALGLAKITAGGNGSEHLYQAAVRLRRSEVLAALAKVDLFVSPSRFLRNRFVSDGMIPPHRIVYSDYGFFVEPFVNLRRSTSRTLRVGYVGTIAEYKGVHLIVDAFRDIHDHGIECRIYGDLDVFPDYRRRLLEHGTPPALRYMGAVSNDKLADVLADLDLLIVPSVWPENSPLTIHEAYLAGLPVLTSNCGGMAELVEDGRTGLYFRVGDAADLRHQLLRVLHEPTLLERLSRKRVRVKTIDEDAAQMEQRYHALVQRQSPVG